MPRIFAVIDHTTAVVLAGCVLIGATSGTAGAYALLRRQALLADAVSHAALPGIVLAFLLTGERSFSVLLPGALAAGVTGAVLVQHTVRWTRLEQDGALALVLSVMFGTGIVLLTVAQKAPQASQAGLSSFLFGQAAAMLSGDVVGLFALAALLLFAVAALWKEWKLISFDAEFAASLTLPVTWLDAALMIAIVAAVVVGLQTVGVVLMSALLVAPAAAARQWTSRFGTMMLLSVAFGTLAGLVGVGASNAMEKGPTGPAVVLAASGLVVVSLLFGRERGVVWVRLRRRTKRRGVMAEQLLSALAQIAIQHDDPFEPRERGLIGADQLGAEEYDDLLALLERRGWIRCVDRYHWALTPEGLDAARRLGHQRGSA
ncbi:MAG: metal ABC transporter permease [Candidatus Dadabacteria bacterium]|nr:MAG: metal ABC transporter permease [Candidatus Dadabacteria bacterium]